VTVGRLKDVVVQGGWILYILIKDTILWGILLILVVIEKIISASIVFDITDYINDIPVEDREVRIPLWLVSLVAFLIGLLILIWID
jgi:hypothetical protein